MLLHIDYNDILNSVKGLKERFWDCVVVDALINNNDRNDENWGILRCNGRDRLAPIFGNGTSFSDNLSENMIEDYMNEIFTEYSNGLFNFEQVKIEMDFIRGKSQKRGKVNLKKFIDGIVYYSKAE